MLRNAITAAAALALTAAPIAAQAAPLPRASADVAESEELRGTTMWIVAALVVGGILVIFWDDIFGDDEPDSP